MSTKLSSMPVGSIVKMKYGGNPKEFIVIHQGKPSSLYDDSCNGTWVVMKDILENRAWDGSNNDYKNSDVHAYLNGTVLNNFDADIKEAILTVKIPYQNGTGSGGSIASGSNGLSCKLFLLSGFEVGFTKSDSNYFPVDGARLAYFTDASKRIAYLNGAAGVWWLRSPDTYDASNVFYVYSDGDWDYWYYGTSHGVRPALVLPSSLSVSDDGSVKTNQPPSAPAQINVPSTIMGGTSISVSWSASTDPDGNLEGYVLERSDNSGSQWSQVYQGTATETTNSVAYGTTSVMYRVKAYDSDGETSAYTTSSEVTVTNNQAPSAPPSITVPEEVNGGKSLKIDWGASTDPENNLAGYVLERQHDSGEWEQVFKGNALTYTDSITKGWLTVAYRVKAYDAYNAESAYTTSESRTVNNNTAPVITCDQADKSNLGEKAEGFTITYSVDDDEPEDTITVTEKIDGVTKRSYTATREASNNFEVTGEYFMKLLNGEHTMTIEASDGQLTTVYTLYFSKKVTALSITLAEPMEADDKITICAVTVSASIPADAEYKVEVTNNAKDDSPVWEDCTSAVKQGINYLFENETATNGFAFNFRVTAERGPSDIGGFVSSIQGGFQ